jgi:hypothetical protein
MGKVRSFLSKNKGKIIAGAGALGLAGAGIYAGRKLLRGRGKYPTRRGSVSRLRSRVQRLTLKIKEKQLKRKLFKEELRI